MQHLSKKAKEIIVKKALSRGNKSLACIANENGIGKSTLSRWLTNCRNNNEVFAISTKTSSGNNLSQSEKFSHLIGTDSLDEISLGIYCRKHGLYSHQLQQWRTDFMRSKVEGKSAKEKAQLKQLKLENKQLKKELYRKEKALAEASALLVMKKKASLIWGESEDD